MSNALEITRDIVVAAFGSISCNGFLLDESTGKLTAEFIQAVYDKVHELEQNTFDAETKEQINEYGR